MRRVDSYYPVGKVPAEVAKNITCANTFTIPLFLHQLNVSLTWKLPCLPAAWMITLLLLSLTVILLLVRTVVLEALTLSLIISMPSAPTMTTHSEENEDSPSLPRNVSVLELAAARAKVPTR
jgi:hypothetical protein